MSPELVEITKSILVFLTAIFTGIMTFQTVKINIKAKDAKIKLNEISKTGDAVHVLVNSNMGIQLKISAIALRRLADLNKNSKQDQMAARLAENALKEHEKSQNKLDHIEGKK